MSASAPPTPQGGPAGGPPGGPSGAPMGDPAAMAQLLDMFSGMTGMLNDSRTVLACAMAIYAWDWLVTLPQGEHVRFNRGDLGVLISDDLYRAPAHLERQAIYAYEHCVPSQSLVSVVCRGQRATCTF